MFNQTIFAHNLKLLRTAHNLSNANLSDLIGLKSRTSISDFEALRTFPSAKVLANIADLFAVSLDWLVGRSNLPYTDETLLYLEEKHLQFFLSKQSIYIPEEYIDPSLRVQVYSLPIRSNIIFLFCIVKTPILLLEPTNLDILNSLLKKPTSPLFDIIKMVKEF